MKRRRGPRHDWRRHLEAALRAARRLPPVAWAALALLLLLVANAAHQVWRKPVELVGAVTPAAPKDPADTLTDGYYATGRTPASSPATARGAWPPRRG